MALPLMASLKHLSECIFCEPTSFLGFCQRSQKENAWSMSVLSWETAWRCVRDDHDDIWFPTGFLMQSEQKNCSRDKLKHRRKYLSQSSIGLVLHWVGRIACLVNYIGQYVLTTDNVSACLYTP